MNAEQVLEQYRQRAGFDGFLPPNGEVYSGSNPDGIRRDARPAWRDPDSPGGWFVLPPEFEWNGNAFQYDAHFVHKYRGLWRYAHSVMGNAAVDSDYPTAPAAFRDALEYLKSQEKVGTE